MTTHEDKFAGSIAMRATSESVVDPRTGELLHLATVDHDRLVEAFLAAQEYERHVKTWRTAIEDELVRRHGDRRAAQVVGDHEVDIDRGMTRKWDAEELIGVVSHLVGEGLLTVMDAQGLVKDEPKVDGRKAAALIGRVDGEALTELRRCFTWEAKGRARVKVTPVAELDGGAL